MVVVAAVSVIGMLVWLKWVEDRTDRERERIDEEESALQAIGLRRVSNSFALNDISFSDPRVFGFASASDFEVFRDKLRVVGGINSESLISVRKDDAEDVRVSSICTNLTFHLRQVRFQRIDGYWWVTSSSRRDISQE